jgi:hypothetical protein
MLLIEYRLEAELNPSPSICGKIYHIQCERFRWVHTTDREDQDA